MKLLDEFKAFALKGNVIDMAVGVIVGGAFSSIVTSLVTDVIMPVFTFLTSGMSVQELSYTLPGSESVVAYGMFIQNIINFLIISVCIFAFIKLANKLHSKPAEEPAPEPPTGPTSEELLAEIRDLLKDKH
ncbi:MAG: large-conductance mechanosensitive channel protein MscL [Butyricicoccus sp.]